MLGTVIPRSVKVSEAPGYGMTILNYDPCVGWKPTSASPLTNARLEGKTAPALRQPPSVPRNSSRWNFPRRGAALVLCVAVVVSLVVDQWGADCRLRSGVDGCRRGFPRNTRARALRWQREAALLPTLLRSPLNLLLGSQCFGTRERTTHDPKGAAASWFR